jgi:hypothetical protein
MKIVGFHSNELNERGTNVAMFDYAKYNEEILGNKSYILSNAKADLTALAKFKERFEVFLYNDFSECSNFAKEKNIEYIYYVKAGDRDGRIIPGSKSCIHAVFQHKDVHGDSYMYISKWLAEKMGLPENYVPYMVDMPQPTLSFREKLNIPKDKIIIGRHGGYTEFDLPFVYDAISETLKKRNDIYFVFMNTKPFLDRHPNIIHIEGTYNMQHKSNYINTCDYMLHGRYMGESFGLALSEFLFHGKPVIAWTGGQDQNHKEILKEEGLWYTTKNDLVNLLSTLKKENGNILRYKELVSEFTPERVMKRFNEMFLV